MLVQQYGNECEINPYLLNSQGMDGNATEMLLLKSLSLPNKFNQ